MNLKFLYRFHRTMSLLVGIPLFIIFVTGFFLAIESWFKVKGDAPYVGLSEMVDIVGNDRGELMRAMSSGPGGETTHLMVNREGTRYLYWMKRGSLQVKNLYKDFFYLNKQIHESFLFGSNGKRIVSILGLCLITLLLSGSMLGFKKNQSNWKKATLHHRLGMILFLVLLLQSGSGILIENFSIFVKKPESVMLSESCHFELLKDQAQSFEKSAYYVDFHTLYFCNTKSPFMSVRLKNKNVIDWANAENFKFFDSESNHPLVLKKDIINFHTAKILSSFSPIYLMFLALGAMFLMFLGLRLTIKKILLKTRR